MTSSHHFPFSDHDEPDAPERPGQRVHRQPYQMHQGAVGRQRPKLSRHRHDTILLGRAYIIFIKNVVSLLKCKCYHQDHALLSERQDAHWQPLIDWFNERHKLDIAPSRQSVLLPPKLSAEARESVRRYLLSYSMDTLQGFTLGVDAIKSIVLMCAVVDKRLGVKEAVKLGRLELEIQVRTGIFLCIAALVNFAFLI
jgi:hypothetical protein